MTTKEEHRFEVAHDRMTESAIPIPHGILRDYLDSIRRDPHSGDMASRNLTIAMGRSWLTQFPPIQRKDIVKNMFSLAKQFGWNIRVAGAKW